MVALTYEISKSIPEAHKQGVYLEQTASIFVSSEGFFINYEPMGLDSDNFPDYDDEELLYKCESFVDKKFDSEEELLSYFRDPSNVKKDKLVVDNFISKVHKKQVGVIKSGLRDIIKKAELMKKLLNSPILN